MKTLTLGTHGPSVSCCCLGAMRFGTSTDEATSAAILDCYTAAGGSFIDTANVYSAWVPGFKGGESEALLGRWMKDRRNRDRLFLATKLGSRFQASGFGLKPQQIEAEFHASLARLQTDYVDLLYAHFDDRDTPAEETLAAFARLVEAGKVRHLGASNFRAWRLDRLADLCARNGWPFYRCVQQRYSFLQPVVGSGFGMQVAANEDLVEVCRERGLRLVAYSPLLGGIYDGRADRKAAAPYVSAPNETRLDTLRQVAAERGVTANQLVLAWMLNQSPAVLPIVAASSVAQMTQNLAALDITLGPEEMTRLQG